MLGLVAALLLPGAAHAAETRYSLQGGCWSLDGLTGAEQVRMQATALGSYLLYRPDGTFVAADGIADAPSPAADWRAVEAGQERFVLTPVSGGGPVTVRASRATGCADFPEAELNATGKPRRSLPFGRAGGLVEGHMHWMTYLYFGGNFHCGSPWHRYGITEALPDCAEIEGPQGSAAPFQNFFNFGNPAAPHDTRQYPQMSQTRSSNLTWEGTYWRWIQRAWLSGLRVMVMGVNENRELCETQQNRKFDCDEMNTVRRGFAAIKELQDYVDAQAGGPGRGFFQIVTNPIQARKVVNQGRMAVILEIEISEPFGCRNLEQPTCDRERVDRELEEMHDLGVRSSLLLNKFDNPLAGVRFDSGPVGQVINQFNRRSAGSYWSARTCTSDLTDNTIETGSPEVNAALDRLLDTLGVQGGTLPTYPPAPHCNTRGLTPMGKHLVKRMMELKMIVNPDHMSQAAVDDTLTLLEARDYSGVISPHGWMDPGNWPRLWKLGGLAFPGHSSAASYVDEWRDFRPRSTPFEFGWGYGADLGGLSQQPRVNEDDSGDINYPFKSYDGRVTFERQTTGERTFDYTKEGVAHYGLYPEWFEDLRRLGGQKMARDMWDGAEAYLQMWERAAGVPSGGCMTRGGTFSKRGRSSLRVGLRWPQLLRRAGQPQKRTRVWTYCVQGPLNRRAADVAVLNRAGRTVLVGSNAFGRAAAGLRTGDRVRFKGLRVRGRHFAVARGGRVRAVGGAARGLSRSKLGAAAAKVVRARATQRRPRYKPSPAELETGGGPTGRTLAGTDNAEMNRALTLLCMAQAQ